LQDDFVKVWNISEALEDETRVKLIIRTSNCLEHYNRHFNSIISTSHPNLVTFVDALHNEVDRVLQRMENTDKGRKDTPDYKEPAFPEIPAEFLEIIEKLNNRGKVEEELSKGEKKGRGRGKKK